VAAPLSSIDFTISSGEKIPIEERDPEEVTNVFGRCLIAPLGVKVRNIAFDVTPHKYVTAIFTERGAFRPRDLKKLAKKNIDTEGFRLKP
jgi:methylthioribose-1-phosphate isomerase